MRRALLFLLPLLLAVPAARAQDRTGYEGDPVPERIERMYARGVAYLAATQADNGSWKEARGSEPGIVGAAVLAMLAAGEDPVSGPHAVRIRRGIGFILAAQDRSTGYIGPSMYNHGFATLALAEAYGEVEDPRIGPALKRAVDMIVAVQKTNGRHAWRYSPGSKDADVTVTGAQMVALLAARNAGLAVPQDAIDQGMRFVLSCASPEGGFGYTSASSSSAPRAAIGALLLALTDRRDDAAYVGAMRYLRAAGQRVEASYPYYGLYYAAQAYFHYDLKAWREWNDANAELLGRTQQRDGSWTGPQGSTWSTAAALLSLALNYRFLPIYER